MGLYCLFLIYLMLSILMEGRAYLKRRMRLMTQLRKIGIVDSFTIAVFISRFSRKMLTGIDPISLISIKNFGMGWRLYITLTMVSSCSKDSYVYASYAMLILFLSWIQQWLPRRKWWWLICVYEALDFWSSLSAYCTRLYQYIQKRENHLKIYRTSCNNSDKT